MAKRYKMKTNKATAKRFKFTATGKVKRKKAGMRHFMRRKNAGTKSKLRATGYLAAADVPRMRVMLPYG